MKFKNEFFSFLKPYKKRIFLIILLQIVSILSSLSIPFLLGSVIHRIEIQSINLPYLGTQFLLLITLYLIWDVADIFLDINFEYINKGVENDIRYFCFSSLMASPVGVLQNQSEGEIISHIIKDTEKVEKTFSSVFKLFHSILNSLAVVVMMLIVNPLLASIVLSFFIIIVLFHRYMAKPLKNLYSAYRKSEESLLVDLKNQIAGYMTIKTLSLEDESLDLLKERNKTNFFNHMKVSRKVSIIKNTNFFAASVFKVATIIIGGWLYLYNMINIGQIFSMYTYTIHLSYELRNIIEIDIMLKDIKASFSRLEKFIKSYENHANTEGKKINKIDTISFKDVSFGYNDRLIIKDLSFEATKGDIIAFKGGNGSGKTTLTYLLCGFYKVDGVCLNDDDLTLFNEREILKRTSYALQNVHLFPTSIMNNLTSFNGSTEKDAIELCKQLKIHDKILSLEKGYETQVNEKNMNLSGGEKQMISIARALLKDSDVLILDEINSALDYERERRLFKDLLPYFENKIVFIISHRDNVHKICNKIVSVDRGDINVC